MGAVWPAIRARTGGMAGTVVPQKYTSAQVRLRIRHWPRIFPPQPCRAGVVSLSALEPPQADRPAPPGMWDAQSPSSVVIQGDICDTCSSTCAFELHRSMWYVDYLHPILTHTCLREERRDGSYLSTSTSTQGTGRNYVYSLACMDEIVERIAGERGVDEGVSQLSKDMAAVRKGPHSKKNVFRFRLTRPHHRTQRPSSWTVARLRGSPASSTACLSSCLFPHGIRKDRSTRHRAYLVRASSSELSG